MESLDYINSISEDKLALDRYVIPSIVEYVAKTNNDITYGELADAVGARRGRVISNQGFAASLGRIQYYCEALGLPCLSAMVRYAPGTVPGKQGFLDCYLKLHPEHADLPEYKIRAMQRKGVLACNEWQKLYHYVGVDGVAPEMRDKYYDRESKKLYEEGKSVLKGAHEESERNPEARAECLRLKGTVCLLCERDSAEIYGVPGVIEVHHIKPLSAFNRSESHSVDPEKDLIPVCPT